MATNIGTELRRLLKKLGGTPSKYDQTNELIHKITDQVESGGGGGIQTIKPVIGEFVQDSPTKGHCSFTATGLKYNSIFVLDFDFERDVSPLLPSGDWDWTDLSTKIYFSSKAQPVWYTWNSNSGARMESILNSEEFAYNDYMSSEEGETFTAVIELKLYS